MRRIQVYYGKSGGALDMTATATADTYTPADLVGAIANSTGYIFPGTHSSTCSIMCPCTCPCTRMAPPMSMRCKLSLLCL